ncbi:MAG: hypothetical protein JO353_02760 [Phycisphaerae bacterium]|nr:hypothetical protein [Phycisphaerae bacterium]
MTWLRAVMDDPFLEDSDLSMPYLASQEIPDQPMSRSTESIPTLSPKLTQTDARTADRSTADNRSDSRAAERNTARALQEVLATKHVCPFCGAQNAVPANGAAPGPCPRCTMEDTAATRQATKARIGPWHVLQTRNPAAPGMRYATLLALVGKGQVTARSIVRGPTTHQLWRWAGHVRGLSREFGICYSCGQPIDKAAAHCPHCDRSQEPQGNPDALLESRDSGRESARQQNTPGLSIVGDEHAPHDPYAATSRSHAERLRTSGDFRPVEIPADQRTALATRRRPDGRILSSMELAAALQVTPATLPGESNSRVRTALLTIGVLAVTAMGVIGYTRPDLRRQANDWFHSSMQPVEKKFDNFTLQPKPPVQQPGADVDVATTGDQNPSKSTATVVNPPPANVPPVMPEQTTAVPTLPVTPIPEKATAPQTPAAPTPQAANNVASAQEHPSLQQEHLQLHSTAGAPSEIRALRSRALDAESREDWTTAVSLYEQIEQYPKELWPGDTNSRLSYARNALGGH